jgi:hypothetical protein
VGSQVVEKDSAILGWPNEIDIASPSHHSGICKFPGPSDQRYQTAIFAIRELIGDVDTANNYGQQSLALGDVLTIQSG